MTPFEQQMGIFTVDMNLVVRSWDDWLSQITGVDTHVACGQPLTALVPNLEARGLLARFRNVVGEGVVEVLSPGLHRYLIPCAPRAPSRFFDRMQQRVTISPLREGERIVGAVVAVEDVTMRRDRERALNQQLNSPVETERLRAAQMLAAEESIESTRPLLETLGDTSWRVRQAVVAGLARHGGPDEVAALVEVIRDHHNDLAVLNSALQALKLSAGDVIAPLAGLLESAPPDLRTYAALALGEQGDPAAAPALIRALGDDDTNVRFHAIDALGKLRAPVAASALLEVVESGDFFLAFPAIDALARLGDSQTATRLLPLLEDDLLRSPVADALGQLGDETAVAPLARLLNLPDAPARAAARAIAAIYDRYQRLYREGAHITDLARGAIDPSGGASLIGALPEANPEELRALALVLGWLDGPAVERALARLLGRPTARREVVEALVRYGTRVTALLIEQLDGDERETREAAVLALGRIGDPRAVPALTRLLNDDSDLVVAAAGALAKIGDRRAFEALLELLAHPDAAVRQAAVAALNSLGHPAMESRVAELLRHHNPFVRESAVKIAGYFGYENCAETLLERCHDADEHVRRAAIEHLPFLENERVLPALTEALHAETRQVRAAAARAFAHIDTHLALPHLLAALDDPNPWVRYFATRSIGRHSSVEALGALDRLLKIDTASQVRVAALETLGRIGGAQAVALVAPFVESEEDDLARAALAALGTIAHPAALPPLRSALRSPDSARRVGATRALGARGGAGVAEALQLAAADPNELVAREAIEALAQLSTPEAVTALIAVSAEPALREECIAALAGMDPQEIEAIAGGLTHRQSEVRRAVVEALARMKHPYASEQLSIALDDDEPAVRLEAVSALGRLGSIRAERKLAVMARMDPVASIRQAAQAALQRRP